jgi:hypothetical protein
VYNKNNTFCRSYCFLRCNKSVKINRRLTKPFKIIQLKRCWFECNSHKSHRTYLSMYKIFTESNRLVTEKKTYLSLHITSKDIYIYMFRSLCQLTIFSRAWVTIDGILDWRLDLLTTLTHDSWLHLIIAPWLISTLYKLLQHTPSIFSLLCLHQSFPGNGFSL